MLTGKRFLFIPAVLVISTLIIFKSGFFNINFLAIQTEGFCLTSEDFQQAVKIKGESIFFIDRDQISANLLQKYLCLKAVEIEKEFPSKIKINLIDREPLVEVSSYVLTTPFPLKDLEASSSSQAALLDWSYLQDKDFMVADEDGVIFKEKEAINLPKLFLPDQEIKLGKQLDKILFNKLSEVIKKIGSDALIKVSGNFLLIQSDLDDYQGKKKLVISLEKDLMAQLASLQLILQKAKIDDRPMEIIDLRFDKPVVIYKQKK